MGIALAGCDSVKIFRARIGFDSEWADKLLIYSIDIHYINYSFYKYRAYP